MPSQAQSCCTSSQVCRAQLLKQHNEALAKPASICGDGRVGLDRPACARFHGEDPCVLQGRLCGSTTAASSRRWSSSSCCSWRWSRTPRSRTLSASTACRCTKQGLPPDIGFTSHAFMIHVKASKQCSSSSRLTATVSLQSVMIDIVVMLFTIVRSYFPSELRWTAVLTVSILLKH